MQLNLKSTLCLLSGLILMTACGGGGGGNSGTGGTGGSGGSGGGVPTAPSWTAGQFRDEAQFKDFCVSPRTGADPFNGGVYPDKAGTAMHEKMWLRSWNNRTYLWYGEVPDLDPASYGIPAYFNLLKTTAVTDSGVAKDQFHFTQNTADYLQQSQSGVSSGYGIEWSAGSTRAPRSFIVAYTEPNSPAALAGVKRGDFLLEVDGVDFVNDSSSSGVNTINAGIFPATTGEQHSFKFRTVENTEVSYQIRSADVASSPVQNAKVLNTDSGPVGYFQFNSYIVPAQQQLINAVELFRDAAISELVVDLRYNGGGLLALAGQLGYMVTGPDIIQNRFFERLQFNDKYPTTNPVTGERLSPTPFYNRVIDYEAGTLTSTVLPNLNLSRIYVLTTENTCSASEAFMNGLRGIDVEVIQIGGKTCGKPYGFYPTDNCGTTYFTIQFSGINSKGFGDYADGFKPTTAPVFAADIKGCAAADDFSKLLGDPEEGMLETALHYIETDSCLSSTGSGISSAVGSLSGMGAALSGSTTASGPAVKNPAEKPLTNSIRVPVKDQQE
ncbi:MAG: peptidase [Gammaproteobacteria bacterium]|nr:peptidase [Gammaproteobacteria bacterium]MBU2058211.1 peptidase [Gammaproteobacteria bacterium]MBU2176958.1 peptidase [Gammaproteobacteria bacterium]MBU2246571.1 peptidase [Gammaproteobacteria bacterium]MBU2344968.1 peptidase [Gammaproteobacteria bacterium]